MNELLEEAGLPPLEGESLETARRIANKAINLHTKGDKWNIRKSADLAIKEVGMPNTRAEYNRYFGFAMHEIKTYLESMAEREEIEDELKLDEHNRYIKQFEADAHDRENTADINN
ncbi:MAG: hypothetical protein Q8P30_01410 [Candidatus Uhrbacteria bacterium]|nr:hypothetical protein [Candidatus Uhrbacteria bacterium]